ncbi:hypothetical protein ACQP3D_28610, partial [Escherichia coli]
QKSTLKDVHYYYYWNKINTAMKCYYIAPHIAEIIIVKVMAMPSLQGTEQLWSNGEVTVEQL